MLSIEPADHYEPGVCNIGPEEIRARRRAYYASAVLTLVLLLATILVENILIHWLLIAASFLSMTGTAVNYLQIRNKFCVAFGLRGVFNFSELGNASKIQNQEQRRLDLRRTRIMLLQSLLVAVLYTTIIYLVTLPS